jgi:hypothetical protein
MAPRYTLPALPAGTRRPCGGTRRSSRDVPTRSRAWSEHAFVTADIRDRDQWAGDAAEAYTSFCGSVAQPPGEAPARLRSAVAGPRRHADVLEGAGQRVLAGNAEATT